MAGGAGDTVVTYTTDLQTLTSVYDILPPTTATDNSATRMENCQLLHSELRAVQFRRRGAQHGGSSAVSSPRLPHTDS